MFPISYNGAVSRGGNVMEESQAFVEYFSATAADELRRIGAKEISIEGGKVWFKKPLFYYVITDWMLAPIDKGFIEITPQASGFLVRYHLSFLRMFVFVSVIVFGVIGFFILSAQKMPLTAKFVVLIFAWLWLFGVQYLVTRLRFPKFVDKLLRNAEKK